MLLARPELKNVPSVVCHFSYTKGKAKISCAYPAQELGIHARSVFSTAMVRFPTLVVVRYQFQQYHEISEKASVVREHIPDILGA